MSKKRKHRNSGRETSPPSSPPTAGVEHVESTEPTPSATESSSAPIAVAAGQVSEIANHLQITRLFSFAVLLAIIGLISVLSYQVLHTFIMPLFVAALLVVIFGPTHDLICEFCGNRAKLAAGLTTAAILLIVLAPIAWVLTIGVRQGIELVSRDWTDASEKMSAVQEKLGLDMPVQLSTDLNDLKTQVESLQMGEDESDLSSLVRKKQTLLNRIEEKAQLFQSHMDSVAVKEVGSSLSKRIQLAEKDFQDFDRALFGEGSVRSVLTTMSAAENSVGIAGPSQALRDQYQDAVRNVLNCYRKTRLAIHGGSIWAPVTELVNPSEEELRSWQALVMDNLQAWLLKLSGQTTSIMGGLLMQLFILTLAIFYFLLDGPEMIRSAMELSPIDDSYEEEMISEFAKLSRAVVVATLLSAIAQGILAGVGYFFVWGDESLFMLIILTSLLAMVPFFGAAGVWVPICLYVAFVENRVPAAIGLGLYGFFVVSMADNVIKPWVLQGQSNLHPLFALLSVLGGVQALGPIGVLVGPMTVAFLQSLLNILHRDLKRMDEAQSAQPVLE